MFNSMNPGPLEKTQLKLINLERLLNLFKSVFNSVLNNKNVYVVFPAYNSEINSNTEAFKLDEQDIEYLRKKYSDVYREELETKLKQLSDET